MRKYYTNNKGGTLALVVIVMAILMILSTAFLSIALAETNFSTRQENKIKAYYLARSGAQSIAEYMVRDAKDDAHELLDKTSEWNEQIGGGRFQVSVSNDHANNVVNIVSVGEYRGVQQKAKIRVIRSSTGVGGIFQYAIAAKNGIKPANAAGNGIVITGDIATKAGTINIGSMGKSGEKVVDPELFFPTIVLPPDKTPPIPYDQDLGLIDINNSIGPLITSVDGSPKYIRTDSIKLKNTDGYGNFRVTGNGTVHLYVNGDLNMDTNSRFEVSNEAKLYIYVKGYNTVKFTGNGAQNNIFLYAPDSEVIWNNSGAGDFLGSIIGNTVILHNDTIIIHDPELANDADLDTTGIGVTYTGYSWID